MSTDSKSISLMIVGVVDRRNKRNILVNGDGFGVAW